MGANLGLSAILHAALAVEVLFYPVPLRSDDTWFGWKALAQEIAARHAANPKTFVFAGGAYKTTAEMSFYLPGDTVYARNVLGLPALEYDFIPGPPYHLTGQDGIFVDPAPYDFSPDPAPRAADGPAPAFQVLRPEGAHSHRHRGRIVRKSYVYRCDHFLGPYCGE